MTGRSIVVPLLLIGLGVLFLANTLNPEMPLFRLVVRAAQARGHARDLTDAAVERLRQDMVFNLGPAQRDFGYAPRPFKPEARMFNRNGDGGN